MTPLTTIIRRAQSVDRDWYRREQLGWLRTLIADYRLRVTNDIDPSATAEMLSTCTELLVELEAEIPPEPENATMPATDLPL